MDIIDFDFVKQINDAIDKGADAFIQCFFNDDNIRAEYKISSNTKETFLAYYYPNGNKKYINNYIDGKLHGKSISWYPNGKVEEEIEYLFDNRQNKKRYFPSGNIELIETYKVNGIGYSLKQWYVNGQLDRECREDGASYIYYRASLKTK